MKITLSLIGILVAVNVIAAELKPEIVQFKSGSLVLHGELFKPKGKGPFPAILYNHGSAPGMLNSQASKEIAPLYVNKGWIFFMPYRRGQGLSQNAGPYIGDEISNSEKLGGEKAAEAALVDLLISAHLNDQLAALKWLKSQKFVQPERIAVAGNSFGGIETVLGAARENYCAAVDASGGAESWEKARSLQTVMKEAVRNSKAPVFFFQAENDYSTLPSNILSAEMKSVGKMFHMKIYPAFGKTAKEGHSFAFAGSKVWFDDVFNFISKHCATSTP